MVGSEQVRFCAECNKYVYDLSSMTRDEAEALIAVSRDRLCAQLTRTLDGAVVTADSPTPIRLLPRRVSPLASAVVSAVMTLSPVGAAFADTSPAGSIPLYEASADPGSKAQVGDRPIMLVGSIMDSQQALVVGARVTLINLETGETQTTTATDGTYQFTVSRPGTYSLTTQAAGFSMIKTEGINLNQGSNQRLNVTLAPQFVARGGAIAIAPTLPLRRLFEESSLIVVARVVESKKVEKNNYAERARTTLQVTSTLKGDPRRAVYVYHWTSSDHNPLPAGDNLLLFLKDTELKGDRRIQAYELVDATYGIKKLSEAALQSYVLRISELREILGHEQPDKEQLLEWLVRCAEDPTTRWEGAYDLADSSNSLCQQIESDDEDSDDEVDPDDSAAESDETTEETEPADSVSDVQAIDDEAMLAALLTANHKSRLMTALLATETFTKGDLELIELAKHWRDPRLSPFLMDGLRRVAANPPRFCQQLVNVVAELMGDEAITRLAEDYGEKARYGNKSDFDEEEADRSQTKPSADTENRSAMLRAFISVVERRLSRPIDVAQRGR